MNPAPAPAPSGPRVCNATINNEQYYSNSLSDIGATLSIGLDVMALAGTIPCFILFLIVSLMSSGPMDSAKILVYMCTFCCLLSVLFNTYKYFSDKSKLDAIMKEGRPCKDNITGTIIN